MAASASGRSRLPAAIDDGSGRRRRCRARRTWSPGDTGPSKETRSPSTCASSTGTTVSAPAGSGAPVAIVIAVCGSSRTGSSPANDSAGDRQLAAGIGRAHGVAVHRGVVERRQVVRGAHVGGDDAAGQRARERERLGRQRREPLEQERPRLVREQRSGIGSGHGPML